MISVAIAGANGYVGRALCEALLLEQGVSNVVGLGRSVLAPTFFQTNDLAATVQKAWRSCDLYSLKDAENALVGVDVAVYLVHSMAPKSRLVQGSFLDRDLLLADNFARAAHSQGVKKIVYLGGMIPKPSEGSTLSDHLRSRLEVESALIDSQCAVKVLRAGIILGAGGSSTEIMDLLVTRLPILVCPSWTKSQSHPIDLNDALQMLVSLITSADDKPLEIVEAVGPLAVTYEEMLREIARLKNRKRLFISLGHIPPVLSALWVSSITGYSLDLVSPLVGSLKHDLLPTLNLTKQKDVSRRVGWKSALQNALQSSPHHQKRAWGILYLFRALIESMGLFKSTSKFGNSVISVQRFKCPQSWNARKIAAAYLTWLPVFLGSVFETRRVGKRLSFFVPIVGVSLLELEEASERSSDNRVLFYVVGGALTKLPLQGRPRLEFRLVKGQTEILAAVLGFVPSLPWPIYRMTQSLFHLFVMKMFGRFLQKHASVSLSRKVIQRSDRK
jgi:uncharacterized protein YbjT (DUF2867 family)